MDEDELKKKLQGGDAEKKNKMEEMKKKMLREILTKEAIERLGRVRVANPQLASQLEMILVKMAQSGRVDEKIDDDKLKSLLTKISQETSDDTEVKWR